RGRRWARPRLESLEDRVLLDSGPRVLSVTPTEVRNAAFDHVDISFDKAIDPTTFTPDDVAITGPSGVVAPTGVQSLAAAQFRVTFNALTTRGSYQAAVGPNIADLSGNLMDQNQDGANGD